MSGQSELVEKYERVNDIVRDIENTFIDFQDTYINAKATIAIFKSNQVALKDYRFLLEEIDKIEKHLDFQIDKIVKYASESVKAESYKTYQAMKREMDFTIPDVKKIHEICMIVIYRIFNDGLIYTLQSACSKEDEEFKYDPYLEPIHPIFGKNLTLFSMVCQTDDRINRINDEIKANYEMIAKANKEFIRFENFSDNLYVKCEQNDLLTNEIQVLNNKINSLNEKIKMIGIKSKINQLNIQLTKENEDLKEINKLLLETKDNLYRIHAEELSIIHKQITGKIWNNEGLSFYLNEQEGIELMKTLSKYLLQDIVKTIYVDYIDENSLPNLKLFIKNSIPPTLQTLGLR